MNEEVEMPPQIDKEQRPSREPLPAKDDLTRSESDEPGRNFEQEVSDINTDPDAGFDFDLNPTDGRGDRRSER
jgi:hypothetical protein